jgi:heme-degrading monooxygenase HmoA
VARSSWRPTPVSKITGQQLHHFKGRNPVKPGEEADFESAFAEAKAIIAVMPGFRRLTLSRCLEHPNTYLLLVEWDRLVDHTEGFRGSPQYQEWRRLLHSYYEPFPAVEHYELVHSA